MIYFHNPHFASFYGTNVFNLLTGRFNHRKYWYLGRHILGNPEKGTGILINLGQNSFAMTFVYKFPLLNRLATLLEVAAWMLINSVNPFRIPLRFSAKGLTEKDVVFAFDNLQRPVSLIGDLENSPCVKVVHLTHYHLLTSQIARHAKRMENLFFAAESDLSRYPYFRRHFPYYRKAVYLLPFVPQKRFYPRVPFGERRMKCLAFGTHIRLSRNDETADFMDFFNTASVHPMRGAIHYNAERTAALMDSGINPGNTDAPAKDVHAQRNPLLKAYYGFWNLIHAKQKEYFLFSAADRFNQYAMAVMPEKLSHLPSMGWVECMACGTAYVGIDDPMYTDLGLVPGEHYIAYDNTLDGLLETVGRWLREPEKLKSVAEKGRAFVAKRLDGETAARVFLSDLRRLEERGAAGGSGPEEPWTSSFIGRKE